MKPEVAQKLTDLLAELVAHDGGTVKLIKHTNDSIEFDLLLKDAQCAECVMPSHFLEQIFLDQAQAIYDNLRSVLINDPRREQVL